MLSNERVTKLTIQVSCAEPPPSAVNMTLPAFAAERRRPLHGAVERHLLLAGCSATNPSHTAADPWGKRTNGRSTVT